MKCVHRLRSARRRGLSILEVLVSIGILVLGLLGVVALIPIAAQHLRRGMALDDATAVARAGIADFQARGGANIQKWLRTDPGGPPAQPVGGTLNNLYGVQFSNTTIPQSLVHSSWAFCIDPLMYESAVVEDAQDRRTAYFPYQPRVPGTPDFPTSRSVASPPEADVQDGAPRGTRGRMLRVALNWNAIDWRSPHALVAQNVGLANAMCVSTDDLLLNSPGSEPVEGLYAVTVADNESPSSQYDVSMQSWDDPAATRVKRNFRGNISWFATLVPLPGLVSGNSRYYTLSVAVVENRDLVVNASRETTLESTQESQQNVEGERTCGLRFVGGGLGGGEVQLVSYQTDPLLGYKNLSRIREGNWILVSGPGPDNRLTNPAAYPNDPNDRTGHIFYWYRIGTIETEPRPSNPALGEPPNVVVRNATLRGPDWPGVTYPNGMAEAIIVSNVINVFEQTIELRGE